MNRYYVALTLIAHIIPTIHGINTGMLSCPCSTTHPPGTSKFKITVKGKQCLLYTNRQTHEETCLVEDYGLVECRMWEDGKVPECMDARDRPLWCTDPWCYVDTDNCTSDGEFQVEEEGGLASDWFPESGLMYSYATCGTASYFAKFAAATKMTAAELRDVPESHVKEIIHAFERESRRITSITGSQSGVEDEGNELAKCEFLDSCECETCKRVGGQWGDMEVDLRKVVVTWNQQERGRFEEETRCLGRQIQNAYRSVAQQTYNDPNRVAYMYFGLQVNGAILSWPACAWCPQTFDSRFRPWYATAVSGPKDVVLTLDNSGSMAGAKWDRLKEGVAKVLDTLTEYDYVGLILFSDITMIYEPDAFSDPSLKLGKFLRPATKELKEDMLAWLRDGARSPMGGTMFNIAFQDTFRFLSSSRRNAENTSGCQTAILFMTDGEDTSEFDTKSLTEMQQQLDPPAIIFTYAFGNGADLALPKEIACAHKGVYYEVPDTADIGGVMSRYYTYFAEGVENSVARWVTYDDAVTGEELMAACLPAYAKDERGNTQLLGAGCMDINMLIRLSLLRTRPAWPAFHADVKARSSQCADFRLTNARLELIRERLDEFGTSSTCKPPDYTTIYLVVGCVAGGIFVAAFLCCVVTYLRKRARARRISRLQQQQHQQHQAQVAANNQQPQGAGAGIYPLELQHEEQAMDVRPSAPVVQAIPVAQAVYEYR